MPQSQLAVLTLPPRPEGQSPTQLNSFSRSLGTSGTGGGTGGFNIGDAASAVGIGSSIGSFLAQLTGNPEIGRYISLAGSTASGAKALSNLFANGAGGAAGAANITGAIQAILGGLQAAGVIKNDRDNAALINSISTALTLATTVLSSTGYGAVLASAIKSGMGLYSDIDRGADPANTAANFAWNSTVGLLDFGGGVNEHINEAFMPSKDWRSFQ